VDFALETAAGSIVQCAAATVGRRGVDQHERPNPSMLELPRISIERQRNVGRALVDTLALRRKPLIDADVARAALLVTTATDALVPVAGADAITIDRSTDSVLSAIWRVLLSWERGGTDRVVAPAPALVASLAAARRLRERWFPQGIAFIQESMANQWDALAQILATLSEKSVRADHERLGLAPLVDHLSAHGALYKQARGAGDAHGTPGPGDVWHDAYTAFAAAVMTRYAGDNEMRATLTSRYDQELREFRTERRLSRQSAKKKAKEAAKAGP
jgi:hypothetical protein